MAIERQRNERLLKTALERHQILLKEMNHRVKNSLTIVGSMLRLKATSSGDPALAQHLQEASVRVQAVGRAHERLYLNTDIGHLDIGRYIEQVCGDVDATIAQCDIHVDALPGILLETDRAISLALMINELITNAVKHAYRGEPGGAVWVIIKRQDDAVLVSVRDEGAGLPSGFEMKKVKGLGMTFQPSCSN